MATCARICEQIDVRDVEIDYRYCEFLSTHLYKQNPIPLMELRNKTPAEIDSEFDLGGVVFTDSDAGATASEALYPESGPACDKRVEANIESRKEMLRA